MESISRLSSMLEQARDLTLDAAREASANRKAPRANNATQIKRMLDSRIEREVLDGLRKVIAMQYTSPLATTLPFFPAVLKTLSNPTPLTRSLVYAYLTHHAEADADTALLSINTIQKSFSDPSPRVRALALRTMSGLRVPVISQIVSLAIKRGLDDPSPVVRKTAAFACVKCVRLDPRMLPQVTEYLDQLLGDQQYYVVGAAVAAFAEVCPDRIDLLHRHYRSIVKKLIDMDEWAQLATLRILTVYARKCFPYQTRRLRKLEVADAAPKKSLLSTDDFYADETPHPEAEAAEGLEDTDFEERQALDPDLELLLDAAEALLQSRNSAVVIAVTKAYLYLAPDIYLPRAVPSLVALLRGPLDVRHTGLYDIIQVCLAYPTLFVPYFRHFLLSPSEGLHTSRLKLELQTLIFPHCQGDIQSLILAELDQFGRKAAYSHNQDLVREAVRAIGRCAQASTGPTLAQCTRLLLDQLQSPAPDQEHGRILVTETLEVVRHLIQRDPEAHQKTVIRLAKNLDTLVAPTARASVIWLVGEFAGLTAPDASIAPDVLRILLKGYVSETDLVREQIILLAAKVYLHWLNGEKVKREQSAEEQASEADVSSPIEQLYNHALLLARYTPSYDLRDRARLFRALLQDPSSTDLASLLLLAPKPVPSAPGPSETRKDLLLGSSTLVLGPEISSGIGLGLKGYEDLPDWVAQGQEPDPALRDVEVGPRAAQGYTTTDESASRKLDDAVASQHKGKTLDSWLNESEGVESSEEESTDGETDDDDESSEDETDDDDEESDDSDEPAGSSQQATGAPGIRKQGLGNDDNDDEDTSSDELIGKK